MFRLIERGYEWLWQHTTGRPYTHFIRESYHRYPLGWVFLILGLGTFLGHLFW